MQVWLWLNQELKELPLEELGTFDSGHVYLVQHTDHKQTPLYTWVEGTIFVWVGAGVTQRKDAVADATHKAKSLGITSKTVCIVFTIIIYRTAHVHINCTTLGKIIMIICIYLPKRLQYIIIIQMCPGHILWNK